MFGVHRVGPLALPPFLANPWPGNLDNSVGAAASQNGGGYGRRTGLRRHKHSA
jgi:hypothetical protein